MSNSKWLPIIVGLFLVISLSVSGVFALWQYYEPTEQSSNSLSASLLEFQYGTIYITRVSVIGGDYSTANIKKTDERNIDAGITLYPDKASTVRVEVTFYNSTDVSYYYNETQTVLWDNDNIRYTVSGIEQRDEIPAKTYKTVTVTFSYNGDNISQSLLSSSLHFDFVVDKESIGSIVAQTAVDRFRDILNNKAFENSYQTLEDAMNERSGFNKASAVTYIGNVSGSTSTDSTHIETLFGEEFMSMDLDGDGEAEPITIMIKREDLDNNNTTGDSYTYTSWGRENTVNGVEMTMYITSENLDHVSSGQSVVVYAAAFTRLSESDEWTQLVPLTKGTANANNYSGYGSANSFNTDTWVSDDGKTIEELATVNNQN